MNTITDDQIAEIEQAVSFRQTRNYTDVENGTVLAIITRLREAERDAARYRWLRDKHNDGYGNMWVSVYQPGGWVSIDTAFSDDAVPADELDLDAAVDAAMQEGAQ